MKIKEVCKLTGLTDRTIRFYIEKGLLKPEAHTVNGRVCRDYSEEDVRLLTDISMLRKAGFSIQNILDMQQGGSVNDIIDGHIIKLQEEMGLYEETAKRLKEIESRGNITWRKLAELLAMGSGMKCKEWVGMHFDEPIPEKSRENKSLLYLKIGICVLAIVISMLVWAIRYVRDTKPMVAVFTITDVTFLDKWRDNGKKLVTIKSEEEYAVGFDDYFFIPRTLCIESSDEYEMILLDSPVFWHLTVRIEVPYGEAKQYELLNSDQGLLIEAVLSNEEFIRSYCEIVNVMQGGSKIYFQRNVNSPE